MDMNYEFNKMQMQINLMYREQFNLLVEQISNLIQILEDHEKDMMNMCDKINELERQLSELKGA